MAILFLERLLPQPGMGEEKVRDERWYIGIVKVLTIEILKLLAHPWMREEESETSDGRRRERSLGETA